jgi:DNA damage-binding protein 1
MLRRNTEAVTDDDRRRLELTGEMRLGEVINKIVPIISATTTHGNIKAVGKGKERSRTMSSAISADVSERNARTSRNGPLIQPQAFIGTIEGAIYMLGAINAPYVDALLRLQAALATRVQAPGGMPWTRYRAWRTETREGDEPFRFVDGEMVEDGLLSLSVPELEAVLRENGLMDEAKDGGLELSVDEVRGWAEELRRLY